MLQPHVSQAEAQLVVLAKTAPWPRLMFVQVVRLRVVDAEWARQQRAVIVIVVKRREGVDVNPEVLHLENARKALPQVDILLQCYLLDLKEKMNALFRFSMIRKMVFTILFG